jgi:hypothetical protein
MKTVHQPKSYTVLVGLEPTPEGVKSSKRKFLVLKTYTIYLPFSPPLFGSVLIFIEKMGVSLL